MRFILIVLDVLWNLLQFRLARRFYETFRDRNLPWQIHRLNAYRAAGILPLYVRSIEEHLLYALSHPEALDEIWYIQDFLPDEVIFVQESGLRKNVKPSIAYRIPRWIRREGIGWGGLQFLLKRTPVLVRIAIKSDDRAKQLSVIRSVARVPRQRERRFTRTKQVFRATRDRVTA
jgi:hypothetical protein